MIGDTPMRRETLALMRDKNVTAFDFGVPRPTDFETMMFQARNKRAVPGEGNLDLPGILAVLSVDLPLSLEAPVQSLAAKLTPVERLRRGRQAVHSLLAAVAARRRAAN